jgi:hypothetical protein
MLNKFLLRNNLLEHKVNYQEIRIGSHQLEFKVLNLKYLLLLHKGDSNNNSSQLEDSQPGHLKKQVFEY